MQGGLSGRSKIFETGEASTYNLATFLLNCMKKKEFGSLHVVINCMKKKS